MATTAITVPLGTVSAPIAVNPTTSVCVVPSLLGGSVLLESSNDGLTSWTPWTYGTITQAGSFRPSTNQYVRVTATTAAASVLVNDISGSNAPTADILTTCALPLATASATTEQVVYGLRIPPGYLPTNFVMSFRVFVQLTNNVNVKTMRLRWGGVAGTALWTSPSLASLAVYKAEILVAGRGGVGSSLLGGGITTSTSGGWGGSTGAQVALTQDYQNVESEIVLTLQKATAGDTAEIDILRIELY